MKFFLTAALLLLSLCFDSFAADPPQGTTMRATNGIGFGVTTIAGRLLATNVAGTNHFAGTFNVRSNIASQGRFHGDGGGLTNLPSLSLEKANASELQSYNVPWWGDSITRGTVALPFSPTYYLSLAYPGLNVFNGGFDGYESGPILTEFLVDSNKWDGFNIFMVGRNDIGNGTPLATTLNNLSNAIYRLPEPKRFVVLSIINSQSWSNGTAFHTATTNMSAAYAAAYPFNYFDMRGHVISNFNNSLPQDVIDHARDVPPTSLMNADTIHPNAAGNAVMGNRMVAVITNILNQTDKPIFYSGLPGLLRRVGKITIVDALATTLTFPPTTNASIGVVNVGTERFMHNYSSLGLAGYNGFVGQSSGNFTMTGVRNWGAGAFSLFYNTSGSDLTANGYASGFANTTGNRNTYSGHESGNGNSTGSDNTADGDKALKNNTGTGNTATGSSSQMTRTTGDFNTSAGYFNDPSSGTGGSYFGAFAGHGSGDYNTMLGVYQGFGMTTGSRNTQVGPATIIESYAQSTSGSRNTSLGNDVAVPSPTANDQLSIGNLIYGTALDGTGTTISSGNIGIGIKAPAYKLDVLGTINASTNISSQGVFHGNALGMSNAVDLIAGSGLTIVSNANQRAFTLSASGGGGDSFWFTNSTAANSITNPYNVGITGTFSGNAAGASNAVALIAGNCISITASNDGRTFTIAAGSSGIDFLTNNRSAATLVNLIVNGGTFNGDALGLTNLNYNKLVVDNAKFSFAHTSSDLFTDSIVLGNGGTLFTTNMPWPIDPESAGGANLAQHNTFVGFDAGPANTSGGGNTLVGTKAGRSNTTGNQNTFIGWGAGQDNTTGYHNTYLGVYAGVARTNGNYNIGIGTDQGNYAYVGTNNVDVGVGAGQHSRSGDNTRIGRSSGVNSTTGAVNTLVGSGSGSTLTTGSFNAAVGGGVLNLMSGGSQNAAIGSYAGPDKESDNSVFAGYYAGQHTYSGSNNTFLGFQADVLTSSGTNLFNSTAVGSAARVTANNQVVIGNTSVSQTILNGNISVSSSITGATSVVVMGTNTITGSGSLLNNIGITNAVLTSGIGASNLLTISGDLRVTGTNRVSGALRVGGAAESNNGLDVVGTINGSGNIIAGSSFVVGSGSYFRGNDNRYAIGATTRQQIDLWDSNFALAVTNLNGGTAVSSNWSMNAVIVNGSTPVIRFINRAGGVEDVVIGGYANPTNGILWQSGSQLTNIYTSVATLDFGNVATIGCADLTMTVTGASLGDVVDLGVPNASVVANSSYSAWVSAADTVTVRFCALISGDPASGLFRAEVHKWK